MLIDTDVLIWMIRGHAGATVRLQALLPWRISAVTYRRKAAVTNKSWGAQKRGCRCAGLRFCPWGQVSILFG